MGSLRLMPSSAKSRQRPKRRIAQRGEALYLSVRHSRRRRARRRGVRPIEKICELIIENAGLPAGIALESDTDLYRAGMRSFSSVRLMLALEAEFDIEFPDEMLTRATFATPGDIHRAVETLTQPTTA